MRPVIELEVLGTILDFIWFLPPLTPELQPPKLAWPCQATVTLPRVKGIQEDLRDRILSLGHSCAIKIKVGCTVMLTTKDRGSRAKIQSLKPSPLVKGLEKLT